METELDTNNKKRIRDDDSEVTSHDSPKPKLIRVDSAESDSNSEMKGDGTPVMELENTVRDSTEVKRIEEDLLNILDESDDQPIQGVDSVIKSFEEILVPAPATEDVTSFSGGSQPELGFLLEASDDELGLPPPEDNNAVNGDFSVDVMGDEALGFGDGLPSFDPFELGLGCDTEYKTSYNESGDFVALGGLFNFSDENLTADVCKWRNVGFVETTP